MQLKPCPFCGGEARMLSGDGYWCQIGCIACGGRAEEFPQNWDKAIEAWNRRADINPCGGPR